MRFTVSAACAFFFAAPFAFAGDLQQASLNQIVNDVQLVDPAKGAHPARLNEIVRDDLAVRTGQKSRAELLFQDETLTRLGAETFFSFKAGTRDLSLQKGTMLLQVPKGLGGARIRTASVTASITGTTIMMEYSPKKHLKVVVLEGSLRLSVNGRLGEAMLLTPGKMVIMDPNAKTIPDPVDVDLRKLVKTSSLINSSGGRGKGKAVVALPSIRLIESEIAQQDVMVKEKGLVRTNLVISGNGTEVVAANDFTLAMLDQGDPRGLKTQLPSEVVPTVTNQKGPDFGGGKQSGGKGNSGTGNTGTDGGSGGGTTGGSENPGSGGNGGNAGEDPDPSGGNDGGDAGDGDPDDGDDGDDGSDGGEDGGGDDGDDGGGDDGDNGGNDGEPPDPAKEVLETAGFQRPSFNAQAPMPTTESSHSTPSTITVPDVFQTASGSGLVRFTLNSTGPLLTSGSRTLNGTIYGGKSMDGSASQFLFGTSSAFDGKMHLDGRFGVGTRDSALAAGVAVFKFDALPLGGAPRFQIVDVSDLALVSVGDVSTAASGGLFDLSNLQSLTIATVDGAIDLDQALTIKATGNAFRFLHLYARGANGVASLREGLQLPGRALLVDAERGIYFGANSNVKIANAALNSLGGITLDGVMNAQTAQLSSASALSLGGTLNATRLFAYGSTFKLTGGALTADTLFIETSGDIAAGGPSVMQGKVITLDAGGRLFLNQSDANATRLDLSVATSLDAKGKSIAFGAGDFLVPSGVNAKLASTGGGIDARATRLTGFRSIAANGGDLQALSIQGGDISGSARLLVANDVTARSVTMGSDIQIGGALTSFNGDIRGRSVQAASITGPGDLRATGDVLTGSFALGGKADIDGALRPATGSPSVAAHTFAASEFKINGGLQFNGLAGTASVAPTSGGNVTLFNQTSTAQKFGKDDDDEDEDEGDDDEHDGDGEDDESGSGIKIKSDGIAGANLSGGDAASGEGGDGGTLQIGTTAQPIAKKVEIEAPVIATTGRNGAGTLFGGKGGTVSVVSNSEISVNSMIKVSDSALGKASRRGGNISLESRKTSGKAISIKSSAQLLALLGAVAPGSGGTIKFTSAGGDISVEGATVQADGGNVEMVNSASKGSISLKNATVRGDVVKIGALGSNGQLIIRGGSINADTTLKLYAGTADGEVRFSDDVTLGGAGTKMIAGRTVTIDKNRVVTVGGVLPAQVFTDRGNYTGSGGNGSSSGRFGGAGATTQPYAGRPGF